MATLDELVVRIKADASQLDRELKRVAGTTQQATGKMSSAFAALRGQMLLLVPALTVGALSAFTFRAVKAADALNDLSARTGVSASYLSAMRTEIENAGGSVEGFAQALFFMNRQIGEAVTGNETVAASFQRLGLDIDELLNNRPEENFRLIAEAISRLPTEFERAEAAAALFGRGVAGLQPIIRDGADGIDAIMEKANELGASLSSEQLQAIDDFGDAMNTLGDRLQNLAAGAFANIVIGFQDILSAAREARDQIRLFAEGGFEALEWYEKSKANGYATRATRETEQYGPTFLPGFKPPRTRTSNRQAIKEVKDLTAATEELDRSMEGVGKSGVISARLIKDSFGDALESAMFDFKSFGNAASSILDGIARNIARQHIIDPLSNAASGIIGGLFGGNSLSQSFGFSTTGGYGPFQGFADGGRPPVGRPSIVGERGPEIFVPDSAGTIIPNGGGMGGGVTVNQYFNMSPGLAGTVEAEVRRAAPTIANAARAAVFADMERGGRASQIAGKRN